MWNVWTQKMADGSALMDQAERLAREASSLSLCGMTLIGWIVTALMMGLILALLWAESDARIRSWEMIEQTLKSGSSDANENERRAQISELE